MLAVKLLARNKYLRVTIIATLGWRYGTAFCQAVQKHGNDIRNRSKSTLETQASHLSGEFGGSLVTAQRSDPRSFNPITAIDTTTRELIGLMHADLIHINRKSGKTEPALAKSWELSSDGRIYTVHLRRGLRFSNDHPMDADDVVFTFRAHLDGKTHSPQRDLLVVDGTPIEVVKIDQYTLQFRLAAPYAAAERLFDGIAILPRHLLWKAYEAGQLSLAWQVDTAPDGIAGLGPFRLKNYLSGQRVVLERNPHYWKADINGKRLPFLDQIVLHVIPTEDAQAVRFQSGELDVVTTLTSDTFMALEGNVKGGQRVHDAGPGFEYSFLVFNMNDRAPSATVQRKQRWFKQVAFRRAVSAAIDRESVVRLVYHGLGDPINVPITKANAQWINNDVPPTPRSLEHARKLLKDGSFSWKDGVLIDRDGEPVAFSMLVSTSSSQRARMATIVQDDLRQLGMQVSVVSADSRGVQDRVLNRQDYEAALMALVSGDADPNSDINVWVVNGSLRMWNMNGHIADWEREIDSLMRKQMVTLDYRRRKQLYDKVQQLISENLPIICIASPHILFGASTRLQRLRPAVLRPYALWNVDELYLDATGARK
jgi:peptide/nickel transport system substrate-binding protein